MLDPYLLRNHLDELTEKLAQRGFIVEHQRIKKLENARKQCQIATQELQTERNRRSKEIGTAKAAGEDITPILENVSQLGDQLKAREAQLEAIQAQLNDLQLGMPNLAHESVPIGLNEADNLEIRRWGEPQKFAFTPKDHIELAQDLDLIDLRK